MTKHSSSIGRRQVLKLGALGALAGGATAGTWLRASQAGGQQAAPEAVDPRDRKLLFVFCAYGGASIIDSFLPFTDTEVGDAELASTLNAYPEHLVTQRSGSGIRYVELLDSYSFYATPPEMGRLVRNHGDDVVVIAHEVSSVNHTVAQQRSLNGAGFDRGRTIMEAAALRYGGGMALPSCNMGIDGYVRQGADPDVPLEVHHEIISRPEFFAAATHGYRALEGAPGEALIKRARAVREQLDDDSVFGRTFKNSPRLGSYLYRRRELLPSLERADMIDKLLLLDPSQLDASLGLTGSAVANELRERFPFLEKDNTHAQVALGFLMAYHGISSSVTMGMHTDAIIVNDAVVGTPIAFDFSHNLHRIVQNIQWGRTAEALDNLIAMLKKHDYMGDPELGKMWDRSLIYVATEFGRGKTRPKDADGWGTSHHLNNGSVLISPLLKGNRVYGGVDPKTGYTFGFDRMTGESLPDKQLNEADVYSIIAHAMGIEFPGRIDYPAVVRG
jgi:hypothetical protein